MKRRIRGQLIGPGDLPGLPKGRPPKRGPTDLLRRVQSGQPLTLAEYVQAEELVAAPQASITAAVVQGQKLFLRISNL
jgi:hypothetical protein